MFDLEKFFAEKDLDEVVWELENSQDEIHVISNHNVIQYILELEDEENKMKIKEKLQRIDCTNGDVNDFLKHLAGYFIG